MGLGKKTVEELDVKGKRVLVRCDFNVPMKEGVITNDNRIVAALPTIKKLIENGGKVILCSHLGKPKNGPEEKFSLAPVAVRLSELLGQPVTFAADDTVVREERLETVDRMIRNVWGEPAAETRAVRVLNLLSAYETVDTLRALAGMLHAPQVWIVDPENGYQPVVVASNSAGIRRHGSLCNLEVELHCPVA